MWEARLSRVRSPQEDYRRTVTEIDEKEYISLRLIISELRNQYVSENTELTLAPHGWRALVILLLLLSPFPLSVATPGRRPDCFLLWLQPDEPTIASPRDGDVSSSVQRALVQNVHAPSGKLILSSSYSKSQS